MYKKFTLKNVFLMLIICLSNKNLSDSNFRLNSENLPAKNLWNESFEFSDPSKLELPGEEFIPLLFVFLNNNYTMTNGNFLIDTPRYVTYLHRMLHSLFSESSGSPLHLIFITDESSKDVLLKVLTNEVGKVITEKFHMKSRKSKANKKWNFPRFRVSLLDMKYFKSNFKEKIDEYIGTLCIDEYISIAMDFFDPDPEETTTSVILNSRLIEGCRKEYKWIQFLLPGILSPSFKRIIILDIDLRLRCDIGDLYKYFDHMNSEQALGLGKEWGDVSYETAWFRGRTLTGLQIGEPYPFLQNLNSGIVLMDLQKLRRKSKYKTLFAPMKIKSYIKEFNIPTWGDQSLVPKMIENYEDIQEFPLCRQCHNTQYFFCKGKIMIEHTNHETDLIETYPTLYKYNNIFKLDTWCDNPTWKHCY